MKKFKADALSIKCFVASTVTVAISTSAALMAFGAPSDKKLTPEQFTQQRAQYLRYQQYVQAQMERMQQSVDQQRQQQLQAQLQQKKQQAEQNMDESAKPKKKPFKGQGPIRREEVLLAMPAKGAKAEDIRESVENAQGEVIGALGNGGLNVILIKPQKPGQVVKLQRILAADTKNFRIVDFNRKRQAKFIPTSEPTFSQAWHLSRMQVHQAWDVVLRYLTFPMPVAVFDTGVEGPEPWISGHGADVTKPIKYYSDLQDDFGDFNIEEREKDIIGFGNAIKTLTHGITDNHGHGTWVACAINGSPYNGKGAAGVNPQVPVFPIKIAIKAKDGTTETDQLAAVKAMCVMYDCLNTPIINMSFGPFEDPNQDKILHEFFKDWYFRKNGLIFLSGGNNMENLSMVNQPYINCISAMAQRDTMTIRPDSATGRSIDYTAPGTNIQVVNPDGTSGSVWGTSLSSPIVAAVASMIWTINPKLKNTEVEKILRDSCENSPPGGWNPQFGWGMPNALKACTLAEGTRKK